MPTAFSDLVTARDGDVGSAWLPILPETLAGLLAAWSCERDGAIGHGQVGLIVPVRSPHGAAVIKISPSHEGNVGEAPALRHLAGRGAVKLYEDEPADTAMLLERLEGPSPAAVLGPEESVEMLGDLAHRLAVPGHPEARPLSTHIEMWRAELEQQVSATPGLLNADAVARAFEGVTLAADDRTDTLLHGDLHEGNVLAGDREPWLAIDPRGLTGTAAYDAWTAALVRQDDLLGRHDVRRIVKDRIRRFARAAHVDADLADAIAYSRLVSSLHHEATQADGPAALAPILDLAAGW